MKNVLVAAASVAVALVTASPGIGTASAAPADSPWTQAQGNAAGSHSNLSETTLTPSAVKGIRHLRTYTVPTSSGSCSGSDGAVLTGGDVVAVVNGVIVRYVAHTGRLVWQAGVGDNQVTDFAVVGNEVVVGYHDCGSVSDPNGGLSAFSLATGKQTWTTPAIPLCGGGVCNSGTTVDRMVVAGGYLVIGGNSVGSGYNIAVLKASNGAVVWKDVTSTCVVSLPVVVDQQVIFTTCSPSGAPAMVADALATGRRTWQDAGSWTVQRGDFAQTRGRSVLATSSAGTVVDVSPATGKAQVTLAGAADVLSVDAARAYATCGTAAASGGVAGLCGYALGSGRQVWKSVSHPGVKVAAEAGGVLYLDSGAMLNAATGKSLGAAFGEPSGGVVDISVGEGRLDIVTPTTSQLYGLKGE